MALISEIADDAPDEVEGATAMVEPKEEPHGESSQGPPVEEPSKMGPSSAGQTLYKECALRVAYIMRQEGTPSNGQPPAPPPREGRCKAMMEVVRKEHGSWMVSKFVVEHNHGLLPGHVLAGGGQGAVLPPAVGTEFESVEAAKTFYYGYGEKLGFKARTGSNRGSAGSGAHIMQRFLCWRGNYLIYRRSSISSVGKRKRGPYKKRAHRLVQEVARAKKDRDAAEVFEVQSSTVKVAPAGADHGQEVQSGSLRKAVTSLDKDVRPKLISSAGLATASMARVKDGGKINPAANTSQSQLLRALDVR